jgi:hypothetical protein
VRRAGTRKKSPTLARKRSANFMLTAFASYISILDLIIWIRLMSMQSFELSSFSSSDACMVRMANATPARVPPRAPHHEHNDDPT